MTNLYEIAGTGDLDDFQVLLPNGAVMGAGHDVGLVKVDGLRSLRVRSDDSARTQRDGSDAGINRLDERIVTVTWDATLTSGTVEAALAGLSAGWQSVTDPASVIMSGGEYLRALATGAVSKRLSLLQIKLPSRDYPLVSFGRPTKLDAPVDVNYQYGKVQVTSEWASPDGLLYDAVLQTGDTRITDPTAGLTFDASFPWTFGSASAAAFTVTNSGTYPAWPVIAFKGPLKYPRLANTTTGEHIQVNVVLNAAQTLVVDCESGVATLNGEANRNNWIAVGSVFFSLPHGVNTLNLTSSDGATTVGNVTVYALPTYSVI